MTALPQLSQSSASVAASALAEPQSPWLRHFAAPLAGTMSSTWDARCGRVCVAMAGELFNRAELRADLEIAEPCPDPQLVAAAFARWGQQAPSHLRGAFALVVDDGRDNGLWLVRDHAGLHPLFYAIDGSRVSVSASAPCLAHARSSSSRLNALALADALCRRYPDPQETFFNGVRRLPAGHVARVTERGIEVTRYWSPLVTRCSDVRSGWEDEFDALETRAVLRVASSRRVGIFLSGGLDSGSIAVVAAHESSRGSIARPVALSLTFPGAACDETEIQRGLAKALNLPQVMLRFDQVVDPDSLTRDSLSLNRHLSAPSMGFWTPAYMQLARAGAKYGVDTVLTGIGGDEFLSASGWEAADLLSRGRFYQAWRFQRTWSRSEDGNVLRDCGLRPILSDAFSRVAPSTWHRRQTTRAWAQTPAWVGTGAMRDQLKARLADSAPARRAASFAVRDTDQSLTHTLSNQFMEEEFEVAAQTGVTRRHPFYDVDLVEWLARVPLSVLNRGEWLKGLVRHQLSQRVANLGYERQTKLIADDLYATTLTRQLQSLGARGFHFPTLAGLGVVDGPGATAFAQANQTGSTAISRVWDLINLEAWAAAHA